MIPLFFSAFWHSTDMAFTFAKIKFNNRNKSNFPHLPLVLCSIIRQALDVFIVFDTEECPKLEFRSSEPNLLFSHRKIRHYGNKGVKRMGCVAWQFWLTNELRENDTACVKREIGAAPIGSVIYYWSAMPREEDSIKRTAELVSVKFR